MPLWSNAPRPLIPNFTLFCSMTKLNRQQSQGCVLHPSRRYERLIGLLLDYNLVDLSRCRSFAIHRYVAMLCSRGFRRCSAMEQASWLFACSYSKAAKAVYEVDKLTKSSKLMNPQIKIRNEVDVTTIDIEGTIGLSEAWQFDNPESRVATYERFKECVSQIADIGNTHIVVNIRSTGGDVNDAMLIYEALRSTGAQVTTRCYGYTASAATIVAQAASPGCREIAPTTLYLVHNSLCSVEGNADELQTEVEMLRQTDRRIAEVYALHSGRSVEEILELMAANGGRGRWLSPEEVIAEGLADRRIDEPVAETEEKPSLVERTRNGVMALLRTLGVDYDANRPNELDDINYIPHPEAVVDVIPASSSIALDEGQKSASQSQLKAVQDPSPLEQTLSSRNRAFERDAQALRMR